MTDAPLRPEGPEIEWKVRLPKRDRIANTLCAFANGCGGRLLVGVRDNGETKALRHPSGVEEELRRVARERLLPPLELSFNTRRVNGDKILEVVVPSADEKPVQVVDEQGEATAYVRQGSSSRPASKSELRQLRREPSQLKLDARMRRLLEVIATAGSLSPTEAARRARMGPRSAKPLLVRLQQGGLVGEQDGKRLWITPAGHRRLKGT